MLKDINSQKWKRKEKTNTRQQTHPHNSHENKNWKDKLLQYLRLKDLKSLQTKTEAIEKAEPNTENWKLLQGSKENHEPTLNHHCS